MKNVFAFLLVVSVTITSTTFAGDASIPQPTLRALGLGGLQSMSDTEGMEIRGQTSAFAMVVGTSFIFGQLVSPDTKNFISGSDVNMVQANAETTSAMDAATSYKEHASVIQLMLGPIEANNSEVYQGTLSGFVGGAGAAQGNGAFSFGNIIPTP